MDNSALTLRRVKKNFGALEVLRGVDLSLNAGDAVAILGPSGAGKSTLLHIAGLMEQPSEGTVEIGGQAVGRRSEPERARVRLDSVGFLFQFHYLLPDFNVLENVMIPSRLAGDDLAAAERDARSLLERLGLSERLTHRPYELSGGEQQRAALARALIRKPKLLLCDEPTGNLDPHTAAAVADLVFSEVRQRAVATILVTHNETLAARADRSYHLVDGLFDVKEIVA